MISRAFHSVLRQTEQPKNIIISCGNNLQEARNNAGLCANTEYLLFLDADDELHEMYIEEVLRFKDADVFTPSAYRYYPDLSVDKSQQWYYPKSLLEGNYAVIGSLIRTSYFKKIGGFKDLILYEDWQGWLEMEEAGAIFKYCPNAIYKIHVRENSRNEPDETTKAKIFLQIRNEALKRRNLL
jgi:cellulose synthase/poly-beta-1,6-N-acetylglucosamine synthase-like glycosyltransferase